MIEFRLLAHWRAPIALHDVADNTCCRHACGQRLAFLALIDSPIGPLAINLCAEHMKLLQITLGYTDHENPDAAASDWRPPRYR